LLMAVFTNPLKVIDSLLQEFSSIVWDGTCISFFHHWVREVWELMSLHHVYLIWIWSNTRFSASHRSVDYLRQLLTLWSQRPSIDGVGIFLEMHWTWSCGNRHAICDQFCEPTSYPGSGLLIQIAIFLGGRGSKSCYFSPPKSGKNRGRCDGAELSWT
jgi:hypothetical protein